MSGGNHKVKVRGANWARRGAYSPGDVPLAQLAREIDRAHRDFFEKRGHHTAKLDPVFARPLRSSNPENNSLAAVAAAYVAMDHPPRGTMLRMAQANGLIYSSLATKVYELRGGQKRRGGRAA